MGGGGRQEKEGGDRGTGGERRRWEERGGGSGTGEEHRPGAPGAEGAHASSCCSSKRCSLILTLNPEPLSFSPSSYRQTAGRMERQTDAQTDRQERERGQPKRRNGNPSSDPANRSRKHHHHRCRKTTKMADREKWENGERRRGRERRTCNRVLEVSPD